MLDLVLAILHHILIFALFGVLCGELLLVRPGLDRRAVGLIASIDMCYGILAGLILVVGFSRAVFAAKGWLYYVHNGFFHAKLVTFLIIGSLSVVPTIRFIRWRRMGTIPTRDQIARVRQFLWGELALFALLPAFGAAMARGYGEF